MGCTAVSKFFSVNIGIPMLGSNPNKSKQRPVMTMVVDWDVYQRKYQISHCMRKPTICIGENKGADQLRSNCEADQRLCFHYTDSSVPLLYKSKISSL